MCNLVIFLVVSLIFIVFFGVVYAMVYLFPKWTEDKKKAKEGFLPKGWEEHKEIRKGDYRIVRFGLAYLDEGFPYFKDKPLGNPYMSYRMEECFKFCEEHRFKEEVKQEIVAEYNLNALKEVKPEVTRDEASHE